MDDDLRARAASLIATGDLPIDPRTSSFGSTSDGVSPCRVCGKSISRGEPAIELVWGHRKAGRSGVCLHPACFQAWQQAASRHVSD